MHKYLVTLLLFCSTFEAIAQENKIYYDDAWQPVKKRKASFYRLYTFQDGLYKVEDHYADGQVYMTGYCTNITTNSCKYREGAVKFYDRDGRIQREGQYKAGRRTGVWRSYYKNSNSIRSEGNYKGNLSEEVEFQYFDSTTHEMTRKSIIADSFYTEQMPVCNFDLQKYLKKNLKYPEFALYAKASGRVIVKFIIDEDGAVANATVEKGVGVGFDEEAIRVVSEMPHWQPGYQNGYAVRVIFKLPIVFKPR